MARDRIGRYLDGELAAGERTAFESHVAVCPACAGELAAERSLIARIEAADDHDAVKAPAHLWPAIEARLNQAELDRTRPVTARRARAARHTDRAELDRTRPATAGGRLLFALRRPLAAAASIALLIGAAAFLTVWLSSGVQQAQATVVDYSLLLDGLAENVDAAVDRFFTHYEAEPVSAVAAVRAAPAMSFALPDELPGGYRLEQAYRLRFGDAPGVAARYRTDHDLIVVFFHPPVDQTRLGLHRESDCHVAGREGHRVEVGPWQLMHFTDPTTCHCLLSQLNDEADLVAVMKAIAPAFSVDGPVR